MTKMPAETMLAIKTKCPCCKSEKTLQVPKSGYDAWQRGALIQRALPTLSAAQREQLITGICDPCWDKYMCADEEEED